MHVFLSDDADGYYLICLTLAVLAMIITWQWKLIDNGRFYSLSEEWFNFMIKCLFSRFGLIMMAVKNVNQCVFSECLPGYACEPVNILYRTTSSEYGSLPPTCYSIPSTYHPMSQKFSEVILTATDKLNLPCSYT